MYLPFFKSLCFFLSEGFFAHLYIFKKLFLSLYLSEKVFTFLLQSLKYRFSNVSSVFVLLSSSFRCLLKFFLFFALALCLSLLNCILKYIHHIAPRSVSLYFIFRKSSFVDNLNSFGSRLTIFLNHYSSASVPLLRN